MEQGEAGDVTRASGGLQQIHDRYGSGRVAMEKEAGGGWFGWLRRGRISALRTKGVREVAQGASAEERQGLLGDGEDEAGSKPRGRGVLGGVEWEKIFATEKGEDAVGKSGRWRVGSMCVRWGVALVETNLSELLQPRLRQGKTRKATA